MAPDRSVRIESDSMGALEVPADRYWGAQTQRSLQNFRISTETMPEALIRAFGLQKQAGSAGQSRAGESAHRHLPRHRSGSR